VRATNGAVLLSVNATSTLRLASIGPFSSKGCLTFGSGVWPNRRDPNGEESSCEINGLIL